MKPLLFFLSIFISLTSLNAQSLFSESFDALNTGESLDGQNGWSHDTSNGGTGSNFGVASMASEVVGFPLSYPNLFGASQKALQSDNTIDSDGPGKLLNSPITSGTFYLSFVINVSDAPNPNDAGDVVRLLNGGAFTTSSRIFIQRSGSGFNVGIKIGDPTTPPAIDPQVYSFNQNHLIVAKYEILSGASNDTMSLYVDPDLMASEPMTANAVAPVSNLEASNNIDRIAFPWNVSNSRRFAGHLGLVRMVRNWIELGTLSHPTQNRLDQDFNYVKENNSIKFNQESTGTLNIYALSGQLLKISELQSQREILLNELKSGLYVAQFIGKDRHSINKKFVVN